MSLIVWILLACLVAYLTKLVGYLVPQHWLEGPRVTRVTSALTVVLLASLATSNAVAQGTTLVLDARLLGVAVAIIALWRKVPFLTVVILGAAATALGRLAGLP